MRDLVPGAVVVQLLVLGLLRLKGGQEGDRAGNLLRVLEVTRRRGVPHAVLGMC